eukprot:gene10894-17015_t
MDDEPPWHACTVRHCELLYESARSAVMRIRVPDRSTPTRRDVLGSSSHVVHNFVLSFDDEWTRGMDDDAGGRASRRDRQGLRAHPPPEPLHRFTGGGEHAQAARGTRHAARSSRVHEIRLTANPIPYTKRYPDNIKAGKIVFFTFIRIESNRYESQATMSSSFVEWNTSKRCQVDSSIPHLPMEIMMQIFDTAEAITWTSTRALRDSATCKLLKSLRFRFGPLMLAKVCDPMNMFLFKRILVSEEYNEDLDIEAAMLNACQAGCVESLKVLLLTKSEGMMMPMMMMPGGAQAAATDRGSACTHPLLSNLFIDSRGGAM